MRSGNPALNEKVFSRNHSGGSSMTFGGTIGKTSLLFIFLLGTAGYTWYQYIQGTDVRTMMMIGLIGSLIFALITIFFKKAAPVTAPVYAALEGFFIGGLSSIVESMYPGIVLQAVSITFGVMAGLLILYSLRIIRVTQKFRQMVIAATIGILIVYLINFILNIFFNTQVPYLHSNGWIGIGINIFIAAIAALNLVLDFDFIERGVKRQAAKHLEWYAAFGLMITLVWLYIEVLRLLQKLRR
ncbi:Bax inhibitor-1/YccA family protein [Halobacillus sp. Marseille-Q1614]|uniref:Bax inhibitor-1/YccA family protein n=1 Tax=Halobacillus sp. Marseille-Q1614 TaxID=2709134 RepID=UPI001570F8AE|nr:Bax inhibitor-1/YccA family protein [Halobacillus sp. Marseille-Q1614]